MLGSDAAMSPVASMSCSRSRSMTSLLMTTCRRGGGAAGLQLSLSAAVTRFGSPGELDKGACMQVHISRAQQGCQRRKGCFDAGTS
jgi:hypothetical protein